MTAYSIDRSSPEAISDTSGIAPWQYHLYRTYRNGCVTVSIAMTNKTAAERLRAARTAADYRTAAAFARAADIDEVTYRSYENGNRNLPTDAARMIARHLGVRWEWLLFGEDVREGTAELQPPKKRQADGMLSIAELEVRAYAGAGALETIEDVRHEWKLPRDLVRGQTSAPEAALRLITVYGDSMFPTIQPGQRVMVDTEDKTPSPPGLFVVWDGLGLVVKRLELIPHSDPLTVRLRSDNDRYSDYERTLDEAYIRGRVVGLWKWT